MKKIRILIADDHTLMRVGLRTMLRYQPDMTVVGEATNGAEAVALAKELKPDVIIMDLMMPVLSGADATRQIIEANPNSKIVVLTSFEASVDMARALKYGARGAQVKEGPAEDLVAAIHTVIEGGTAISRRRRRRRRTGCRRSDRRAGASAASSAPRLKRRRPRRPWPVAAR